MNDYIVEMENINKSFSGVPVLKDVRFTLKSGEVMDKAVELVRLFVLAGFKKIHLDTSMRLADDPRDRPLTDETIARRGARLYAACEEAYQTLHADNPDEVRPVYIVGSEVPIPGGAQDAESSISVTRPEALNKTVETYRGAFAAAGCADGFENVIGVVVQPGVEFGDADFFRYNRANAKELTAAAKKLDGIVLEGHSTDYQPAEALREMVEDGIAILKVGPALTFGLREGLFALDMNVFLDGPKADEPGCEAPILGPGESKTYQARLNFIDHI